MRHYLFPAISGLFVWFFATIFFVLFGDYVLFRPGTKEFVLSTFLLLVGTGILLYGVTMVYLLFDKTENASLKFGLLGTMIGLMLDTFSLSNHIFIFPKLNDSQVIAFSAWMAFAYALYILIPAIINKHQKTNR
jgi:hypothetical protein